MENSNLVKGLKTLMEYKDDAPCCGYCTNYSGVNIDPLQGHGPQCEKNVVIFAVSEHSVCKFFKRKTAI